MQLPAFSYGNPHSAFGPGQYGARQHYPKGYAATFHVPLGADCILSGTIYGMDVPEFGKRAGDISNLIVHLPRTATVSALGLSSGSTIDYVGIY